MWGGKIIMFMPVKKIESEKELEKWLECVADEKLYIAGAGSYGKLIGEYFRGRGISWDGYLDKNESKTELLGKNVKSYAKAEKNAYVIISANKLCEILYQEIHNSGILDNHICVIVTKNYMISPNSIDNRILNFENKYNGKRCFIIGNGPSLSISDLDKIKGEYSFGCNAIFGLFGETSWRPNFYCTIDTIMIEHLYTALGGKAINWDCDKFSFRNEIADYDVNHEFITCNIIDDVDKETGLPGFSDNCGKYVYTIGTVTYYMLQLAVYMGFKEIVLLGIDFNFPAEIHDDGTIVEKDVQAHGPLIEMQWPTETSALTKKRKGIYGYKHVANIDKQYGGFCAAKKYADTQGIKILNASRYTKLDVFPCIDFDEYLHQYSVLEGK